MVPLSPVDPRLLDRLDTFVGPLFGGFRHRRERELARAYVRGVIGPGERKTVAPIVQRVRGVASAPAAEARTRAWLNDPDWSHQSLMVEGMLRLLDATEGWLAYTLDDTALLKQGHASVGVGNQYAGCVGGLANCQVLVSLGVAQEHVSAPCLARLFLPTDWCDDPGRRATAHVPTEVAYQPKWQIGLDLVRRVVLDGGPRLPLLADSLYGKVTEFRVALQDQDYPYVAGIPLDTKVWAPGTTFRLPSSPGVGRPTTRLRPDHGRRPKDLLTLARSLPATAWHTVAWRQGSRGLQTGRFAALRVRPSHGWNGRGVPPDALLAEEWLLLHWPEGEPAPTKAWFANLAANTPLTTLIALARLRWRIERDYQEDKGLLGLDHYEGRTWAGLHHHVALVLVAHQFLARERWDAVQQTSPPPPAASATDPEGAQVAPFSPCDADSGGPHVASPLSHPRDNALRDRGGSPGGARTLRLSVLPDLSASQRRSRHAPSATPKS